MKIAIIGAAGRMGRKLCELAEGRFEVVARIDAQDGFDKSWPEGTEAAIDFSHHSAAPAFARAAAASRIPYVIGSTGLEPGEQAAVEEAAKTVAVVQSANFSLGVNVLEELVRQAAALLDAGRYDAEVVEMHHRRKKDAPSGTALMLARALAGGRGAKLEDEAVYGRRGETGERPRGEIGIHALRGGSVVGDHSVLFAGELECLELSHRAFDRAAFAAGALEAAAWAASAAPGLHSMRDVLFGRKNGACARQR